MKKVIYLLLFNCVQQANTQGGCGIYRTNFMLTANIKPDTGPFLFLKDAKSAGIDYTFGFKNKASGFKFSADYIMGTNDESGIAAYAKEKDIVYNGSRFTKSKPSGLSLMAGPNIMLLKKVKKLPMMWLDLQAGAVFSNQQRLAFFTTQAQGKVGS